MILNCRFSIGKPIHKEFSIVIGKAILNDIINAVHFKVTFKKTELDLAAFAEPESVTLAPMFSGASTFLLILRYFDK